MGDISKPTFPQNIFVVIDNQKNIEKKNGII